MNRYEDEDDGMGLGTLAAGLGGAAFISPYGRRARKLAGNISPNWTKKPLGKAADATKTYAGRAASAMTGGASDTAARTYRNRMQPAVDADRLASAAPEGGFRRGVLQDHEMAKAQAGAGWQALKGMVEGTPDAARVLTHGMADLAGRIKGTNASPRRMAITTTLDNNVDPKLAKALSSRNFASKGNRGKKGQWEAFQKTDEFKSLDADEQGVVRKLFQATEDVKTPREALFQYSRLRRQNELFEAQKAAIIARGGQAQKTLVERSNNASSRPIEPVVKLPKDLGDGFREINGKIVDGNGTIYTPEGYEKQLKKLAAQRARANKRSS